MSMMPVTYLVLPRLAIQVARPSWLVARSMKANVSVTWVDEMGGLTRNFPTDGISQASHFRLFWNRLGSLLLTSPSMSLLLLISTLATSPNLENLQRKRDETRMVSRKMDNGHPSIDNTS